MNVKIASDLHIEYHNFQPSLQDFFNLENSKNNVLVLAGDIGSIYKFEQLFSFIKECTLSFKLVIYILGNHEYYYKNNTRYKQDMTYLKNKIMSIQSQFDNLYILDNDSLIVGSYCFLGTTLWCNPNSSVPDHIKIYGLTTDLVNNLYNESVNYIHKMIKYCKEKSLKLIVISHYCPTPVIRIKNNLEGDSESINIRETDNGEWYANNLNYLLSSKYVHTWICGHIHRSFDYYTKGGTRFIGNQKGKGKGLVKNYSKNFLINLN